MSKKKRYDSLSEMVLDATESKDFAKDLEKRLAGRQIVKRLLIERVAQGLSQEDMAQKLNCSQSKISKLEASDDADVRLEDLVKYGTALGLSLQLLFFKKGTTVVDQVKYHFFETKRLLDRLVHSSNGDEAIAKGAAMFFSETMFNYITMIFDKAATLPQSALQDIPLVRLINEHDCEESATDPKPNHVCSPAPLTNEVLTPA